MMNTNEKLKEIVKSKYSLIVEKSNKKNYSSCCGPSDCGCKTVDNVFIENYNKLAGYLPEADLKLGCGIPTEHAGIKTGDNVLDLGSGAGNDCFVARAIVGENGNVTGLDFTDKMIKKAQNNNAKLGYSNVKFIKGDIEIKSDIQTIITDEILSEYLTSSEIQEFKNSKTGIYSITVTARKK